MEFFSGHDINGDGKNDIYIRHKGQGDPTGIGTLFFLIFVGLFTFSLSFFSGFNEEGGHHMAMGIMAICESAVVAGILSGWLYGHLGRSYSIPLGAIGLFFAVGFLSVGVINRNTASEKNRIREFELKKEQDYLEKGQKQKTFEKAIKNKIRPIQEKLIAKASSRGWIDNTGEILDNQNDDGYRYWIYWPNWVTTIYSISALAPSPLQGLEINVYVRASGDNVNGSDDNWNVSIRAFNQEARDMIRDYYIGKGEEKNIGSQIDGSLRSLEPGKLKDLANELAGYLYPLKIAAEKASQEFDQEVAVALEAQKQQEAKDRDNELRGWVVVCVVATGSILAIFGLVFFLKRKNKLTTIPPTPAPPQDKPAITTAQRYKYTCSGCSARYKLTQDALGKSFLCKKCKITCWVPMDMDQLSIE